MKRIAFLIFFLPVQVLAHHAWFSFDICKVHKDTLPPGLTLQLLPDAKSPGAALLNTYCTQCHNLPGPDRHTAAEWREVTSKMFMLMEVTNQFGALKGKLKIMQEPQQEILLAYLEQQASGSVVAGKSTVDGNPWLTRTLALLPFLLLIGLGLLRWWKRDKIRASRIKDRAL